MFRENVEAAFKEGPTWRLADLLTQSLMGRMGIPYQPDAPTILPEPRNNWDRGSSALGTMAGLSLDPLLYAGGRAGAAGLQALLGRLGQASGLGGMVPRPMVARGSGGPLGESARTGRMKEFLYRPDGDVYESTLFTEGIPYQRTAVAGEGTYGTYPKIRPDVHPRSDRLKGSEATLQYSIERHRNQPK